MAEIGRLQDLFINGILARHIRLFGQNDEPARVDLRSESLITIDTVHARIHEGRFYSANALNLSLADTTSITILIRTGNNQSVHARPLGICGGDAQLDFFEGPTVTSAGTAILATNRNRFSTRTAVTTAFLAPTTSADGVELDSHLIVGGTGPSLSLGGESIFGGGEWILKDNTDYLLRLTNRSGAGQPAHLQFDFYEP